MYCSCCEKTPEYVYADEEGGLRCHSCTTSLTHMPATSDILICTVCGQTNKDIPRFLTETICSVGCLFDKDESN